MPFIHATVSASGRQYRVKSGDTIVVDRLSLSPGDSLPLNDVVLLETDDGNVQTNAADAGVSIKATVLEHFRGKKLRVFKMRRRKSSRRSNGHRQDLTKLSVEFIQQS